MQTISLALVAYLWGSLSPSFIVVRWKEGIDLRRYGTGNVGSSNVGEQLGWTWTIGVGCLDLLKGMAPALLARLWGFDLATGAVLGIATVIGHNWSVFLGLKGGRGLAPAVGVLIAWDARLAAILLAVLAIGWLLNESAPGALMGLVLLMPATWLLREPAEIIAGCALVSIVIAVKRLEANRLPLPNDARQRQIVLLRRFWQDRDVPRDQPWQERRRIL